MTKNRKLGYFSRKQRKLLLDLFTMFKKDPSKEVTIKELVQEYALSDSDVFSVIGFIQATNVQALTA